jgi:hypothetical protein
MKPSIGLAFVVLLGRCDSCDCDCEELETTLDTVEGELYPRNAQLSEAACELLCTHASATAEVGTPVTAELVTLLGMAGATNGTCGEDEAITYRVELVGPNGRKEVTVLALDRGDSYDAIGASFEDDASWEIGQPTCEFVRDPTENEELLATATAYLSTNPAVIARTGQPVTVALSESILGLAVVSGNLSDGQPARRVTVEVRGPNETFEAMVIIVYGATTWEAVGADLDGNLETMEIGDAVAGSFVQASGGGGGWD